jgi:general secretion pathway protein D
MRHTPGRLGILAVVLAALLLPACGAKWAYRQGKAEVKKGNWDLAVARLTKALEQDPDNIGYKMALENTRMQASRYHHQEGMKALAANDLDKAAEELVIATKYDIGNRGAADDLADIQARIQKREDEKRRLSEFGELKERAKRRFPVPVLSPRSKAPITFNFPDQGLQKIFDALAKISGVNILFDPDFRDKKTTVNLKGVSFQEALDQITFSNRLFYKVIDRNTIIIVPESQAKRRVYDDIFLRTFYIQNAEMKEVETVVKTALGAQAKVVSNPTLGAINIIGTVDELALAERVIDSNDKSKGEVMVDVQILEVDRIRLKEYGIGLANYTAKATLAPFSNDLNPTLDIRAHLMSSLNLSDFVLSIPAQVLAKFVQNDANTRILAAPRLRAAEGKKTALKIGQEVPVPVTTFTSAATGGAGNTFAPATSFQYRNVGVNLEITPKVNASGEILLEMAAEFSLPGTNSVVGGTTLPTFLTRNVTGILRLRDGETALVGGLISDQERETLTGALGIIKIPVIGKFLSQPRLEREQSEVLISITPHLVRAPKILETDLVPMRVGTKETFRVEGARDALFGEGEPEPEPSASPATGTPSPTGPEIGRPPGTVSPGMPAVGNVPTPASTPPPPTAVPTPIPIPPAPTPEPQPTPVAPPPVTLAPPPPADGIPPQPQPEPTPVPSPTPLENPPPPQASAGRPDADRPRGARQAAAAPTPSSPVSAALTPPQAGARIGETVGLSLVLMNLQGLEAVEGTVAFDPALLEAQDVRAGPLLTLDGAPIGLENTREVGRARFRLARGTGVAGSGVVASLSFRALAVGPAEIKVESLTLTTSQGVVRPAPPAAVRVTVAQ